jgi:hypothetical protein
MKKKKRFICYTLSIIALIAISNVTAQTVTVPRPVSPQAEVKQTIGLTQITVNYSRPNVIDPQGKDRTDAIWGSLVPYGFNVSNFGNGKPSPWRAGANENTTIAFTDNVKIEGKELKAGKYGLFIEVKENNEATVIFSANSSSWGSFFYEPSEDVLRVPIKSQTIPFTKLLTYNFIDYTNNTTILALDWEKKRFPITIEIAVNDIVIANFKNELRSTAGFTWQGYMNAAQYCLNAHTNETEAMKWIDVSIKNNKNFQNLMVKSQLLLQTGNKPESNKVMEEAIKLADANQINIMGYQLMGLGKTKRAIEIFQVNVKRNPNDANAYDSLGEAYKKNGDKELAIKNFKKSLSLNPPDYIKNNSIKNLKELGVNM